MRLKICLCSGLFFGFASIAAQNAFMERITIEHGLSQGMIFDITQSRDGFLWIATKDGLNRYDGYNFRIFSNDPFDPYSLAENTVAKLFEDSRGLLWIGLESKGMDVYNPYTGRFHHFELNFRRRNAKGDDFAISSIAEAADGAIYLLQRGNGLARIVLPQDWKHRLADKPQLDTEVGITMFPVERFREASEPAEIRFSAMQMLPGGGVRVYTESNAYEVQPGEDLIHPVDWLSACSPHKEVWSTLRTQLVRFRGAERSLFPEVERTSIGRLTAQPNADGSYWISLNEELWHLWPGEPLDLSRPDWTLDARITAVANDRNGNIWVGTQGYGLRKINPRKRLFHSGAEGQSIWGLWRSPDGAYFCKIFNEVYPYNPVRGILDEQRAFNRLPQRVMDMYFANDGSYWLLGRAESETGNAEIRQLDPRTGRGKSYPFSKQVTINGKSQPFQLYPFARLIRTREEKLLASGIHCMLALLDPRTGRYAYFDYSAVFKEKPETVQAIALAESPNGVWWIGTPQGLVKGIPQEGGRRFELIQATPANRQGLNSNSIACLLPDPKHPDDLLWIGTKGGGINRLDTRSGKVMHFDTKYGLPDNVVYGILPGQPNELWFSTNRGLGRIRLDTARMPLAITVFTAAQGLQDNEFNTQAFFRAANGELLFGGVNGLNRFFPEQVLPDTVPPPVYLVGLRINQRPPVDAPLWELPALHQPKPLRLKHYQNNLSFEFAALDFTDPTKNRYRYRLIGADLHWVETGTYRFAHFTHLAPGKYTLLAEGNNGEGPWQPLNHPVAIVIQPPWWRSWGAYAAYGMLALALVHLAYRFQLQRLKEREQLAFEHREAERIRAVEQMKTNFFSNVTHEFRTPLTLILEPLRQLSMNPDAPDRQEKIRLAESSSHKLLGLVNQLLDLAKIESGTLSLDSRVGNPASLVREVLESFLPLAEKKGIHLTLHDEPLRAAKSAAFVFDAGKVELILNNLLSNALKFTPAGGQVTIHADLQQDKEAVYLAFSVSDTGIGISSEALDKVFDRFYQVDNPHLPVKEGAGIGLALCKELVQLMGGSIHVESEPGQGTTFDFRIPLQPNTTAPAPIAALPIAENVPLPPPSEAPGQEFPVILVVEDNPDLRHFIKHAIEHRRQVVEASDGEEGLRKAIELLPDLVISDLMMPNKDGYALCHALKNNELTAHIPVILLTARTAPDAKLKGLRTGADDYLTKPFSTEELLARVDNLIALRRQLIARWNHKPQTIPPTQREELPAQDREFLKRLTLLLEQHLSDETLGVEDFARKMYISRVQLHRKLKAITGSTATDFIKNYRLDRAHAMLLNKEGLVSEIAMQVGFGNEKYFSTVFKEKFGVPPSQV